MERTFLVSGFWQILRQEKNNAKPKLATGYMMSIADGWWIFKCSAH